LVACGPLLLFDAVFGWSGIENRPLALLLGTAMTVVGFFLLRFLFRNRHVVHDAAVCYVMPDGKDPDYFANCQCGWLGLPRTDCDAAFAEARKHTTNVRPEVETQS
jgi:hypothetical protein